MFLFFSLKCYRIDSSCDKELSTFRKALPQFIAVGVKNLVLLGNYENGLHDFTEKTFDFVDFFDENQFLILDRSLKLGFNVRSIAEIC